MTKFVIKGTGSAAQAMLKESLAAQDAKFQASLDAFFKSPSPSPAAAAVQAVAGASPAAANPAAVNPAAASPAAASPPAAAGAAPGAKAAPAATAVKTGGWELGKARTRGAR